MSLNNYRCKNIFGLNVNIILNLKSHCFILILIKFKSNKSSTKIQSIIIK